MNEREFRLLLSEIRVQLNRNGLPADLEASSNGGSQPDINAIRLTIEREEKTYQMLTVA